MLTMQCDDHVLISLGYTHLKLSDHVTTMGSDECLEEVMLKLGV